MKRMLGRIAVAGLMLLLWSAAASAFSALPVNGSWVSGGSSSEGGNYPYSVTLPTSGKLTIRLRNPGDSYVRLAYANGDERPIAQSPDLSELPGGAWIEEGFDQYLNAGTYTLGVFASSQYQVMASLAPVTVDELEPNDRREQANALTLPASVTAIKSGQRDVDRYRLTLTEKTPVRLTVKPISDGEDCHLLFTMTGRSSGTTIWQQNISSLGSTHWAILPPDTYDITSEGGFYGWGGLYSLELKTYVAATSLRLEPATTEIDVGQEIFITPHMAPPYPDEGIDFTSSAPNIARIDPYGRVTAIAPGTATITARTFSGLEATARIRVLGPVTSNYWLPKTVRLTLGFEYDSLPFTVMPSNGSPPKMVYKSSKPSVASIAEDGTVTCLRKGKTTITATPVAGGKSVKCVITVVDNVYTRKKPVAGKQIKIYFSTKQLRYLPNGSISAEVFVVNREKKKLIEIRAPYLVLENQTAEKAYTFTPSAETWKVNLAAKKIKVLRVIIRPLEIAKYPKFDFGTGRYEATLGGELRFAEPGNARAFTGISGR